MKQLSFDVIPAPVKKTAKRWIDWDRQPLGRESDAVIARRLGVYRTAVVYARKVRGIPRVTGRAAHKPQKLEWSQVPFGKAPDSQLAALLGVDRRAVANHRIARGVAVYGADRRPHAQALLPVRPMIAWDQLPLGVEADGPLARRLGIPAGWVTEARIERGIKKGGRTKDTSDLRNACDCGRQKERKAVACDHCNALDGYTMSSAAMRIISEMRLLGRCTWSMLADSMGVGKGGLMNTAMLELLKAGRVRKWMQNDEQAGELTWFELITK